MAQPPTTNEQPPTTKNSRKPIENELPKSERLLNERLRVQLQVLKGLVNALDKMIDLMQERFPTEKSFGIDPHDCDDGFVWDPVKGRCVPV